MWINQGRADQFPLTSCVDCMSTVQPGNRPGEGDWAPEVLQKGQAELWTQPTCVPAPGPMLWPGGTAVCSEISSFFLENNSEEGAFELFPCCKQGAKGLLGCFKGGEMDQCSSGCQSRLQVSLSCSGGWLPFPCPSSGGISHASGGPRPEEQRDVVQLSSWSHFEPFSAVLVLLQDYHGALPRAARAPRSCPQRLPSACPIAWPQHLLTFGHTELFYILIPLLTTGIFQPSTHPTHLPAPPYLPAQFIAINLNKINLFKID